MRSAFGGLRGRVTFTVLAVTAVVFSVLATVGFTRIAAAGRDAIEERTAAVADDLAASLAAGGPTIGVSTADGVSATVVIPPERPPAERDGEVVVVRPARSDDVDVLVVARSSEAPLTDSLRSLYRVLWIGVPIAAVVSALLAGAATRPALRPVDDITRQAASVGPDPHGARVPEPGSGDEIDRLARTVNEMLDRIETGRAAQRQFTSDAAHELRTPLMALQGEIELLGTGAETMDATTAGRLDALCQRLGNRIDDLVLLATMDEGRPLHCAPVDLTVLVAHEAAAVAPDVTLDAPPTALVDADADLLARAVRNLVANATRHAATAVAVRVEVAPDRVWVHVDDDGPGIPPAQRAGALARFGRLDEARSTDRGGAGLGLAIVASVAEAHGGGAQIDAAPMGGARVSIWLPVPRSTAAG